jgi:DNA polymerase-3 subunit epsilon
MALPAFTIFDTETTGLDPRRGNRIIEIAGVRVEGGTINVEHTFVSFVNPEIPIPFEARQVNKISDADVANAPTIMTVLPEFLTFAKDSVLVAHNASFDMGFLQTEKEYCWGYIELPECLCTMRLSQSLYPQEFRHNLDTICRRFQLQIPSSRHRALTDVLLTAEAFLRMIEAGNIRSLEELRQRAGIAQLVA